MSVTGIFAGNVFLVPSMILQLSIRIIILMHAVTKKVVYVRNGIESGSFHWLFTGLNGYFSYEDFKLPWCHCKFYSVWRYCALSYTLPGRDFSLMRTVISVKHMFPMKFRPQCKIATFVYRFFDVSLQGYLSQTLCAYEPTRNLRSLCETLLKVPKRNTKTFGAFLQLSCTFCLELSAIRPQKFFYPSAV